jgi:phosphoribosylformylglycinamidine synthase subunit PurS
MQSRRKSVNEHRIEVWYRPGVTNPAATGLCNDIADLAIRTVEKTEIGEIYLIRGNTSPAGLKRVSRELLVDAITQQAYSGRRRKPANTVAVEVWFKEGVTDTVGETALKGIKDLGLKGTRRILTGRRYFLTGRNITAHQAEAIAGRLLANEVIQTFQIDPVKNRDLPRKHER